MNKPLFNLKRFIQLIIFITITLILLFVYKNNRNTILGISLVNDNSINKITVYIKKKKIIVEITEKEIVDKLVTLLEKAKIKKRDPINNYNSENQIYLKNGQETLYTIYFEEDLIVINDVFYKDVTNSSQAIFDEILHHVENPPLIPVDSTSLIDENILTSTTKLLVNNEECTEYIRDIYDILTSMKLQKLPYKNLISGGGRIEFYKDDMVALVLVFHGDRVNINGDFYLIDELYYDLVRDVVY